MLHTRKARELTERSKARTETLLERLNRKLAELQAEAGEGIEDEFEPDDSQADDDEEEPE